MVNNLHLPNHLGQATGANLSCPALPQQLQLVVLLAVQEYNICFTTVKRPLDGSMPGLPSGAAAAAAAGGLAPLPTVIQGLVRRRREVKAQMKNCRLGDG
jgi:hypothetical protein